MMMERNIGSSSGEGSASYIERRREEGCLLGEDMLRRCLCLCLSVRSPSESLPQSAVLAAGPGRSMAPPREPQTVSHPVPSTASRPGDANCGARDRSLASIFPTGGQSGSCHGISRHLCNVRCPGRLVKAHKRKRVVCLVEVGSAKGRISVTLCVQRDKFSPVAPLLPAILSECPPRPQGMSPP